MRLTLKRCTCGGYPSLSYEAEFICPVWQAVIRCEYCGKEVSRKQGWYDKTLVPATKKAAKLWNEKIMAEKSVPPQEEV